MLPLLYAHVQLFPLLFKSFIGQFLSHLVDGEVFEEQLVVVKLVLHLVQLPGYDIDIDVLLVFNQADLTYKHEKKAKA